jgi:hypothetical protein
MSNVFADNIGNSLNFEILVNGVVVWQIAGPVIVAAAARHDDWSSTQDRNTDTFSADDTIETRIEKGTTVGTTAWIQVTKIFALVEVEFDD